MTKRLQLLFLSVAALLCVTRVLAQVGPCDPDCGGMKPRDKVADPFDCTWYYLCIDADEPADVSLPCPDGTSFNSVDHECTGTLPCENICTLPACSVECSSDPGTLPDPKNCSSYYICSGGNVYGPLPCSGESPYFNSVTEACEVSPSVCCRDPCLAYCVNGEVETQDPYDCHKYYLCPASGPADPSYHFTCASGQYFDVVEGKCIVGADCSALCASPFPGDNTTTPEGGNSTPTSVSNTPTIGLSTSTKPNPNCLDSMICTYVGYFPKCTTCEREYFICQYVGLPAAIATCLNDKVFNTDPVYAYCVSPSVCPFHP